VAWPVLPWTIRPHTSLLVDYIRRGGLIVATGRGRRPPRNTGDQIALLRPGAFVWFAKSDASELIGARAAGGHWRRMGVCIIIINRYGSNADFDLSVSTAQKSRYWPSRQRRLLISVNSPVSSSKWRSEVNNGPRCLWSCLWIVFTALHAMQTRYSDENSVCLSVCPSVCQTRDLWQNGRKIGPDFNIKRKTI